MAVSVATFRVRFPEFEDVLDPRVTLFIGDAELQVNEDKWGRFYALGVQYLAAHLLSIDIEQSASAGAGVDGAGPVYSETVGPLNYKRAVLPMALDSGEAQLASTSYGLRYIELRKVIPNVGYMVVGNATYTDAQLG